MPTQYGELKNGLRAYVTYSVETHQLYNSFYVTKIKVTNGGIMAPAPISKDIVLAAGNYELYVTGAKDYWTLAYLWREKHTFTKGNSDRWQQVFSNTQGYSINLTEEKTTQQFSLVMKRETSPIYQTVVNITVPTKPSYTVSYSANGANVSGTPSAQTKWYGETLTLSSTRPTRTGYTFAGWATSSGGSVAYQPGGSYTANSAATLYAKWTPISVTLSYNANGGSGAPASQTKVKTPNKHTDTNRLYIQRLGYNSDQG